MVHHAHTTTTSHDKQEMAALRVQMLGHKSATMTLDLSGHLFGDRLDVVADAMDSARASALSGVYPLSTTGEVIELRRDAK
jgi:hypothetical protein